MFKSKINIYTYEFKMQDGVLRTRLAGNELWISAFDLYKSIESQVERGHREGNDLTDCAESIIDAMIHFREVDQPYARELRRINDRIDVLFRVLYVIATFLGLLVIVFLAGCDYSQEFAGVTRHPVDQVHKDDHTYRVLWADNDRVVRERVYPVNGYCGCEVESNSVTFKRVSLSSELRKKFEVLSHENDVITISDLSKGERGFADVLVTKVYRPTCSGNCFHVVIHVPKGTNIGVPGVKILESGP